MLPELVWIRRNTFSNFTGERRCLSLIGGETTTLRPSNYPLRIAFLSGYNSRDEGSNVSANRAAETGRKGRATTP
jgi:hypothetical protein